MRRANVMIRLRDQLARRLRAFVVLVALAVLTSLATGPSPSVPGKTSDMVHVAEAADCPWVGSSDSTEDRVRQVLTRMTLDEKINMLGLNHVSPDGYQNYTNAIPRLCVPRLLLQDGPAGVRRFTGVTQLPAPISVAAAWDPSVASMYGTIQGTESWGKGIMGIQSPDVNMARVPQNGRTFEAYGEDPYLVSQTAVADIKAIQRAGVMAMVKHYLGNEQETDRRTINDVVDERTLREMYLPPFEAAVRQADVAAAMCAYNKVNGHYACEHSGLLTELFKREYGFTGFIRSDYGSIDDYVKAYNAGMDLAKPPDPATLKAAVLDGRVPMARVDDAVARILGRMFDYKFFDRLPDGSPDAVVTSPEHAAVARHIAEQGTVLLKNADNTLPLDASTTRSIAVIGPAGDQAPRTGGGGSSYVRPPYVVSPYEGIKNRAGEAATVTYQPGIERSLVPTEVLTPPSGTGHGLLGEYYNNTDRSGSPVLTRVDSDLDFNWKKAGKVVSPGPGVNADYWSARWTGTLTAPATGTYTFSLTSDDGSQLYIDGRQVVDDGGYHARQTRQGTIDLVAGKTYQIRIDYFNDAAHKQNQIHLEWVVPGNAAFQDAVAAAKAADVAVVVAGSAEGEGTDRGDLSLLDGHDQLISAVADANPHTIVVLNTGSAVTMPWLGKVAGVLQGWYGGQETGNALAAVLFGDVDPGGRLPITFPKRASDTPAHTAPQWPGVDGNAHYSEGINIGYRWYDQQRIEPLFPFGYGLSYTTFSLSKVVVAPTRLDAEGRETIGATVTNTGDRAGSQVVQLYIGVPAAAGEPPRQLKGYAKVHLRPGESKRVTFQLSAHDLAYWDSDAHRWTTAAGDYRVMLGTSSRDIRWTGGFHLDQTVDHQ